MKFKVVISFLFLFGLIALSYQLHDYLPWKAKVDIANESKFYTRDANLLEAITNINEELEK